MVVGSKYFTIPWTNLLLGGGFRFGVQSMHDALEATLKRLGTDCVDLYQIHFPFPSYSQEVRGAAGGHLCRPRGHLCPSATAPSAPVDTRCAFSALAGLSAPVPPCTGWRCSARYPCEWAEGVVVQPIFQGCRVRNGTVQVGAGAGAQLGTPALELLYLFSRGIICIKKKWRWCRCS